MQIDGVGLKWLGHASFKIKTPAPESKTIYIDPYNLKEGTEKADIILITHSHYDHCSLEDINKIVQDGTKIFITADCQSKIARLKFNINMNVIEPNKETSVGKIRISTLPAYNIDKHFHPQNENWIGYLVRLGEVLIYHAGDTDLIPEMQKLTGFKGNGNKLIALLPVGGRYTMTAEEAAEAAFTIKPTLAVPMHYGSVAGNEEDAKEFVQLCEEKGINAKILERD